MEGRVTGLPKQLADLFPDRLVDSELGPIPEGWVADKLGSHVEFQTATRSRVVIGKAMAFLSSRLVL